MAGQAETQRGTAGRTLRLASARGSLRFVFLLCLFVLLIRLVGEGWDACNECTATEILEDVLCLIFYGLLVVMEIV